jgi:tripartite-type tricarboxylate transporter receptor subunit TctC
MMLVRLLTFAVLPLLAVIGLAQADTYPTRPIKIVVSYPAGGANDIIARSVAPEMTQDLGQSVVVENRSGAGGTMGADSVAKAPADGYTLLMAAGAHALAPSLYKQLPYDVVKDLAPISIAASSPYLLVAHPSLPADNVAALVALAKAKPGEINFASSGVGAPPHLAGVLFQKLSGTTLTHIPYRGDTPALTDLIAGQVQLYFSAVSSATAHLRGGKLKALAVTSKTRSSALPEVPTLDESGLKGYDLGTWWGLLGPAATPRPIIERLNASMRKAIAAPAVQARFRDLGLEPRVNSPEEYAAFIREEVTRFAEVAKAAGVEPE